MQPDRDRGPPPSEPSQVANCRGQIKKLEAELERAREQRWDVDLGHEAVPDQYRLASLDEELATITALQGPVWDKLGADLTLEKRQIEQRMLDGQPVSQRLRTLLRKVDEADAQLGQGKKHLKSCRARPSAAESAAHKAEQTSREQEQQPKRFKTQQAALVAEGVHFEAPSAPLLQLDASRAQALVADGLDKLGPQVHDVSLLAWPMCEQVPQCAIQAMVRLEAPAARALAAADGTATPASEAACGAAAVAPD
ncbi:unnamed protein product [Prorocentrum cordatum]|uniref:Uncharacterized protein n=1 Tax=Prorocentrum cordatum TaxID=2364126 RepID=A0ABN9TCE8_9DINO|nr:unnamed protein product [Polarella glacialis]